MPQIMVHPHRNRYLRGLEDCVSVTWPKSIKDGQTSQQTFYFGAAWIKDCTLRVQPAGVARAQREQVRNVHAWGVGEHMHTFHTAYPWRPVNNGDEAWRKVTYHFNSGEFRFLDTGENVTGRTFPYAHIVGRDFYVLDVPVEMV